MRTLVLNASPTGEKASTTCRLRLDHSKRRDSKRCREDDIEDDEDGDNNDCDNADRESTIRTMPGQDRANTEKC